ncbi:MAG: hypothetical protein ACI9IP_001801 [Arcticibacterium sp.]|jgi:hypothetical protein
MKNRLNEEVQKTLNSLENVEAASAPDFFYTRLKARMENELSIQKSSFSWILKPAFVVPTLALVLAINVLTVRQFLKNDNSEVSSINAEQAFMTEYNLNANYSIEIY